MAHRHWEPQYAKGVPKQGKKKTKKKSEQAIKFVTLQRYKLAARLPDLPSSIFFFFLALLVFLRRLNQLPAFKIGRYRTISWVAPFMSPVLLSNSHLDLSSSKHLLSYAQSRCLLVHHSPHHTSPFNHICYLPKPQVVLELVNSWSSYIHNIKQL